MRFRWLSEIGDNYMAEEGTHGHRFETIQGIPMAVWFKVTSRLKEAIVSLRNAKAVQKTARPGGSVKDLIRFHSTQQTRSAGIGELQQRVDYYRRWLRLEGMHTDEDGNFTRVRMNTVVYDHDAAQQGMTMVRFRGSRLFTDDACRTPLDTKNMVTHFSGPGKGIYVMSYTGNIHVSSHVVGERHHSSLLAGIKTACAGEIQARNGRLTWLSNKSGHYQPDVYHVLQILHMLQKRSVPLTFAMTVCSADGQDRFPSVADFMKAMQLAGEPDYEYLKLIDGYSRYLTPAVLGQHRPPWYWYDGKGGEGVYEHNTGRAVPHKEVRRWLKSRGIHGGARWEPGTDR